jgi:ADP-ribose pyrophosphatase
MNRGETLFSGCRFRVERVVQTTPDGTEHPREVVRHPGAVVILPILDDGRICLVKNYRVAVDETLIELPAGTLEAGEEPATTAQRELAEETGYRLGRIEHLADFYMSPGILDEKMYLFLATSLQAGNMALEPGEEIQTMLATRQEAIEMVRDGRIHDSKTMLGLLYHEFFHGTRE